MTDQPSSRTEPSMEDILASIRRIIDDEEGPSSAPSNHGETPVSTRSETPDPLDEDAVKQARAEYDAAMATSDRTMTDAATAESSMAQPDPAEESIFPERGGALWRRVAGHPLPDGASDPLPADIGNDDAYELTEALAIGADEEYDELELNELLDETAGDPDGTDQDSSIIGDSIGIGAMTAAGVGAAGIGAASAYSGSAMDRITTQMSSKSDADDEVLDLTRRVDDDGSIEDLAAAMSGDSSKDDDSAPIPIFERVDVGATPISSDYRDQQDARGFGDESGHGDDLRKDQSRFDQSFERAAVTGLPDDYAASFNEDGSNENDAHERALDDRFYTADDFEDDVPEIEGDYAASLGAEPLTPLEEAGQPTPDELDTVGGLVRDALRSRMPAQIESDQTPLVTGGAEDSAARSLAALARYDAHAPRRIYGGIKITDDEDSPTIEGVVQDTLRPMLRDWLNDNLPTLVESMVKQEVERISARSRRFVRDEDE